MEQRYKPAESRWRRGVRAAGGLLFAGLFWLLFMRSSKED